MSSKAPPPARFLVRRGSTDWMVYDRERKGPAQLKKDGRFAQNLTREQAEQVKQALTDALNMQADAGSVSQPSKPGKPRQ
ncbi:hypothetical protein [Bradyrhizobium jicamae]|uniref:hypothetical protein n=1 Tax=Bradyrhizobium jicamae TaxID=280332 RepID=UPI002013BE6E|nr:hypothetical protein [Bradyrhizobium jicamae]